MPTITINQLHFNDLDPIRFEELILSMVYRSKKWKKIDHYGKKGSDDGIDICAVDEQDDQSIRTHYYKCKRYDKITKSQLKKHRYRFCYEKQRHDKHIYTGPIMFLIQTEY